MKLFFLNLFVFALGFAFSITSSAAIPELQTEDLLKRVIEKDERSIESWLGTGRVSQNPYLPEQKRYKDVIEVSYQGTKARTLQVKFEPSTTWTSAFKSIGIDSEKIPQPVKRNLTTTTPVLIWGKSTNNLIYYEGKQLRAVFSEKSSSLSVSVSN
jgi:hypothetical protein